MPIDQMLVVTPRPIEEAVNSVPGLLRVQSITSRGSAEVDLFFDWNADMILTLQRVDAVVARLQAELPQTAKVETHRLTFAVFPIIGYSLTSDTVPPNSLWEIATYDMKPRINRLDGVASVIIQGGLVPEFQVMPDPARLLAASVTVTEILDAIRRTNLIDSPGLLEHEHHLVLGLISGQVRSPEQIGQIVVTKEFASRCARFGLATLRPSRPPRRRSTTIVTANGKPAVLLNVIGSRRATRSTWRTKFTRKSSSFALRFLQEFISSLFTINRPLSTIPSPAYVTPCCLDWCSLRSFSFFSCAIGAVACRWVGHPSHFAHHLHRAKDYRPELNLMTLGGLAAPSAWLLTMLSWCLKTSCCTATRARTAHKPSRARCAN